MILANKDVIGAHHCNGARSHVEKADILVCLITNVFASYCQVLHTCQEECWDVALLNMSYSLYV